MRGAPQLHAGLGVLGLWQHGAELADGQLGVQGLERALRTITSYAEENSARLAPEQLERRAHAILATDTDTDPDLPVASAFEHAVARAEQEVLDDMAPHAQRMLDHVDGLLGVARAAQEELARMLHPDTVGSYITEDDLLDESAAER